VREILYNIKNKKSTYNELAQLYHISITQISRIKNGTRWNYLKKEYPELYE